MESMRAKTVSTKTSFVDAVENAGRKFEEVSKRGYRISIRRRF